MYRRVNSGRFIVVTTAGIVVVMAIFTWVMYGMAKQVFIMTDVMIELNESFKSMVVTQTSMATDMHNISVNIAAMDQSIAKMNGTVGAMAGSVASMTGAVNKMTANMNSMTANMNRMTYDIGQASNAFSHPMSYMWGNSPFFF